MTDQKIQRDSFVFYRSFFEAIESLPKEERSDCFEAIARYALYGETPQLTSLVRVVFMLVKPQIDANNKRFKNGCKGGAPKGNKNALKTTKKQPKNNLSTTKKQPNVNDNVNVNVNDNVNENVNVNRYGELKNVRLTTEQYNTLSDRHSNINQAIEVLDTWLGTSGSKHKNKNHFAYFKSNSWVWERVADFSKTINTRMTRAEEIDEHNLKHLEKLYGGKQ